METAVDTIRSNLDSMLNETDDPELQFQLRQSLQLLAVVSNQQHELQKTLENAEISDDMLDPLSKITSGTSESGIPASR